MDTSITDDNIKITESSYEDVVDWRALDRFWPVAGVPYGKPGTWFAHVGRTRPQRLGLTKLKPDRGARGCRWGDPAGQVNELAGEVIA